MRWNLPDNNDSAQNILDRLLVLRGIEPSEQEKFLSPELEHIHSHSLLHDASLAASQIIDAKEKGKKMYIYGDYDVDGVCATTVLWDFLYRKLGADVLPFIPNRFDDGYGLSPGALDRILADGGELIITVDCGIKDAEIIDEYSEKGLEFIITDHHTLPGEENSGREKLMNSRVLSIVHPRHPESNYPFVEVCGANVAWKLAQAVNENASLDADMTEYLDLVAMATVCDVMPLIDENRAIVKFGLERTKQTSNPGLKELLNVAGVKINDLQAYHYGFALGPRINASGRLKSAMDALRLLTTKSENQARELAQFLHEMNTQRQEMTRDLIAEAESAVQGELESQNLLVVVGEDWPEGIVGLVAGKLTEKYHRPVIAGSLSEGKITGSARSIPGMHIADAFKQIDHLIERHGGHAQAAGFTINAENLESFKNELQKMSLEQLSAEDLERTLNIDLVTPLSEIDVKLITDLEGLQPFGFGNTNPVFAFMQLKVGRVRVFGQGNNHVAFMLSDDTGKSIEAIAFGKASEYRDFNEGDTVDVAGSLGINRWNGQELLQIKLSDIRNSE